MEGRVIARPNVQSTTSPRLHGRASMEGRAIARPNKPIEPDDTNLASPLQWRAGQLPGQTREGLAGHPFNILASMEGRAIARPNRPKVTAFVEIQRLRSLQWRAGQLPGQTAPRVHLGVERKAFASMEGRAIARPNRSSDLVGLTCPFAGDCERSCKHALRRCWDSVFKLHFACVCKASSGP